MTCPTTRPTTGRAAAVLAFAALSATGPACREATPPPAPTAVRVDERLGERVPLDLWFADAAGRRVQLRELFTDDRPALLVLTYVRCKMLCSLVLHGAMDAVRELPLALGRDYRVVLVSIDHREDTATAAERRREVLAQLGRDDDDEDAAAGLTYLVGAERPIRALADSLGFHFVWDPRTEQYAHPAVVFVIAPGGTIARYFHGVEYPPDELAAALRGEPRPSSVSDAVLSCFRFDPALRAHREMIERYLQIGGGVLAVALGSTVALLFLWERRRTRRRVP